MITQRDHYWFFFKKLQNAAVVRPQNLKSRKKSLLYFISSCDMHIRTNSRLLYAKKMPTSLRTRGSKLNVLVAKGTHVFSNGEPPSELSRSLAQPWY